MNSDYRHVFLGYKTLAVISTINSPSSSPCTRLPRKMNNEVPLQFKDLFAFLNTSAALPFTFTFRADHRRIDRLSRTRCNTQTRDDITASPREISPLAIISSDELATQLRHTSCRAYRVVIFGFRTPQSSRLRWICIIPSVWELLLALDHVLEQRLEQSEQTTSHARKRMTNATAFIAILCLCEPKRAIYIIAITWCVNNTDCHGCCWR